MSYENILSVVVFYALYRRYRYVVPASHVELGGLKDNPVYPEKIWTGKGY